MVYVNLSKLLQLIVAIWGCPIEVPKREEKLIKAYLGFVALSDHKVSIAVDQKFERIKEVCIDEETAQTRKFILMDIINQYTERQFNIPMKADTLYLISSLSSCLFCEGMMVVVQSRHGGRKALLYTPSGGVNAIVYTKHCTNCSACAYPAYIETTNETVVKRKYMKRSTMTYFSITSETFFEASFLDMVTEDLFTCYSRFSSIVEKYNRLFSAIPLIKKRLIDAYMIYAINSRLDGVEFPIIRDSFRNINIEESCRLLYPELRRTVDSKWKEHRCALCATRIGNYY